VSSLAKRKNKKNYNPTSYSFSKIIPN